MLSKFAQAKWRWGVLGLALVLAAAVFGVIALTGGGDRAQAQQQQFHGASIQKVCAGPNGNAAVPRAREGDTVTCTIRVTNIDDFGDALTINSIVDVVHHRSGDVSTGNLLAAPVVLAAKGDSVERLHTYVVAVADNDPLFDDATTNGTDPVVGSFTLTFPGKVEIIHPHTTLTKTASPTSGRSPLPVTYTYKETNDGDDPITGVTLTDNKCSPLARQPDAPGNNDNILGVGETWVFTCSMTLTATTTNVVTASGTASDGLPAPAERAEATVTVIRPETTLTKTASPTSGRSPLPVTYTYREKNTGDVPITGVTLTDNKCSPLARQPDAPGNNDNILDVGETWVFTCSVTLTQTTTNVVTATGKDPLGGDVPERATATVVVTPPGEGCTPGFWKTHTDATRYPKAWPPTGYSPTQRVSTVFTVPAGYASFLATSSLAGALAFQGGNTLDGAAEILLRAAVAAVLNSAHPAISYPRTVAGIVADVNAALASSDRSTIISLASALDADNNLGCPISGK